jgi:hypothetical protein
MRHRFAAHGAKMSADLKNFSDFEPVGLLGGARTVRCDGAFIPGSGVWGGECVVAAVSLSKASLPQNEVDWSPSSPFGEI